MLNKSMAVILMEENRKSSSNKEAQIFVKAQRCVKRIIRTQANLKTFNENDDFFSSSFKIS